MTGKGSSIEAVYKFPANNIWFGVNRQTSDAFINDMQRALDTIKTRKDASGKTEYEHIKEKYIGGE